MRHPATEPGITKIDPPRRWPGLGLGELWRTRRVLIVLARRQLMARYSNAILGMFWVLLEPVLLTIIITVLLGLVLGRGDRYGLPFPVFIFIGWLGIRVWSRAVSQGSTSIRSNAALVDRVYIPRAHLPLSVALVSLVDWVTMTLALFGLLWWFGISPGWGLLTLPVLLAILYAFALGCSFLFSAAAMSVPDMDFVRGLFVRSWFWLSPVFYPSSVIPEEWRTLYYLNPMVVVIDGFRWAFAQSPAPPPEAWVIGAASATVVLVGGYVYFRRREPYFADLL